MARRGLLGNGDALRLLACVCRFGAGHARFLRLGEENGRVVSAEAESIAEGKFNPDKKVAHTHEGSIGNLCNDKIKSKFNNNLKSFNFEGIEKTVKKLLSS